MFCSLNSVAATRSLCNECLKISFLGRFRGSRRGAAHNISYTRIPSKVPLWPVGFVILRLQMLSVRSKCFESEHSTLFGASLVCVVSYSSERVACHRFVVLSEWSFMMFLFRGQSPAQAAALVQAAEIGLGLPNALEPGDKGGTRRLAAKILGRGSLFPQTFG